MTLALLAGCIPAVLLFARMDSQAMELKRQQPTVPGVVTAVGTELTDSNIFIGDRYDLRVDYEYKVGGVTYRDYQSWEVDRPDDYHGYSPGKKITVYYNPAQPGSSEFVLMPSGWVAPLILMPVSAVGGCVVVWVWALRRKRNQSINGTLPK